VDDGSIYSAMRHLAKRTRVDDGSIYSAMRQNR
jgi:hypothetical protein